MRRLMFAAALVACSSEEVQPIAPDLTTAANASSSSASSTTGVGGAGGAGGATSSSTGEGGATSSSSTVDVGGPIGGFLYFATAEVAASEFVEATEQVE